MNANPYNLQQLRSPTHRLDLSSEQLLAALLANLRAANERKHAVEAYCKTNRGGAVTATSRSRLKREARSRVERARIALDEARAIIARLKRETDAIEWAAVVG